METFMRDVLGCKPSRPMPQKELQAETKPVRFLTSS